MGDVKTDNSQTLINALEENERLKRQLEQVEARAVYLENSMKRAIDWIDGDLRDIIRDVGHQICSYNDLYESADRIEELLLQAFSTQADELEKGGRDDE